MEAIYDGFIGRYSNVFPDGFCANLIENFEDAVSFGVGMTRQEAEDNIPKHHKADLHLYADGNIASRKFFNNKSPKNMFYAGLQECFLDYASRFSVLRDMKISSYVMKMQRTSPGDGYHLWHCEQSSFDTSSRVMVYTFYLNSLEPSQAGETEFLYQQKRFSPVENTMLLWPASYTHAHRGNPVFGEKYKYIVTGWFQLEP